MKTGDEKTEVDVVVDFEDPSAKFVTETLKVEKVLPDAEYNVKVEIEAKDANLVSVTKDTNLVPETPTLSRTDQLAVYEPETVKTDGDHFIFTFKVPNGEYLAQYEVKDLAGHSVQNSFSDVLSVPKVITISSDNNVLGGNKETYINFKFSEAIEGFTIDDIKLTSDSSSLTSNGELTDFKEISNFEWRVKYTSPSSEDKKVKISVDDGQFTNNKGIPGKGASLILEVKGALPTVKSVSFTEQLAPGKSLDIAVEFSTEVEPGFSVTLGDAKISMEQDGSNKKVWEGKIEVPDTSEQSLPINIEGYQDSLGNTGKLVERTLTILPSLTVKVIDPEWVNVERAKVLKFLAQPSVLKTAPYCF